MIETRKDQPVDDRAGSAPSGLSNPALNNQSGLLVLQEQGVLIVDDHELQLRLLQTIAEKKWQVGPEKVVIARVERLATFDEVVDSLVDAISKRLKPDGSGLAAIISDYDIADTFNSERVWREVHKRFADCEENAAWKRVARVLMSATLHPGDRDRILGDRVMDAFIEKPVDFTALTGLVCHLISERQPEMN